MNPKRKPIQFLDLKACYLESKDQIDAAYQRVMDSGWYLFGAELDQFEAEFASYVSANECVAVGSGLDALVFALQAFGIGKGDEVIVPAQTFIASWFAVTMTGAEPVGVDVQELNGSLNPSLIEAALTERTRAIMPVHLFGVPSCMDEILSIARQHDLVVIEDAAQAHGALWKGKPCGTLGDIAAFSFYPGKNVGAFGDGGCVVTNRSDIADRIRLLRNYGATQKYHHEIVGYNSRMDELQAGFLRVKLAKNDEWNRVRQTQADRYKENLRELELEHLHLPKGAVACWHLFPIFTHHRKELAEFLQDKEIATLRHYPIIPSRSDAYRDHRQHQQSFPVAESMAETELSLPIGPHLTLADIDIVSESIREFFAARGQS